MGTLRNIANNSTGRELALILITSIWVVIGTIWLLVAIGFRSPAWPYVLIFEVLAGVAFVLTYRTTHSRPTGLAGLVGQGMFVSKAGIAYEKRVTKMLLIVIVMLVVGLLIVEVPAHTFLK